MIPKAETTCACPLCLAPAGAPDRPREMRRVESGSNGTGTGFAGIVPTLTGLAHGPPQGGPRYLLAPLGSSPCRGACGNLMSAARITFEP